jgi:hypothetical protein
MHPFVITQPRLATNRQVKAVRQLVSDIHKNPIQSRTKEEANLKQVVSIVLPNAVSSATPDVRQWFAHLRTQIDPPDLFDVAWTRYQHTVHLSTRYPCMDAMRYGCQLNLPNLVTTQLKAGYGVNAMIEVTDPVSKEKRLTYPIIEASTRFQALKVLFHANANIHVQNPNGETALSTAVARVKRAQSTSIQHRNSSMDMDLRDGPVCVELLLGLGCKRGKLSSERMVRGITRKLARERWARVRKLVRPVSHAAGAFLELLVHVQYMPGSKRFRECQAEYEFVWTHRMCNPRGGFEVDPAEYLDGE